MVQFLDQRRDRRRCPAAGRPPSARARKARLAAAETRPASSDSRTVSTDRGVRGDVATSRRTPSEIPPSPRFLRSKDRSCAPDNPRATCRVSKFSLAWSRAPASCDLARVFTSLRGADLVAATALRTRGSLRDRRTAHSDTSALRSDAPRSERTTRPYTRDLRDAHTDASGLPTSCSQAVGCRSRLTIDKSVRARTERSIRRQSSRLNRPPSLSSRSAGISLLSTAEEIVSRTKTQQSCRRQPNGRFST